MRWLVNDVDANLLTFAHSEFGFLSSYLINRANKVRYNGHFLCTHRGMRIAKERVQDWTASVRKNQNREYKKDSDDIDPRFCLYSIGERFYRATNLTLEAVSTPDDVLGPKDPRERCGYAMREFIGPYEHSQFKETKYESSGIKDDAVWAEATQDKNRQLLEIAQYLAAKYPNEEHTLDFFDDREDFCQKALQFAKDSPDWPKNVKLNAFVHAPGTEMVKVAYQLIPIGKDLFDPVPIFEFGHEKMPLPKPDPSYHSDSEEEDVALRIEEAQDETDAGKEIIARFDAFFKNLEAQENERKMQGIVPTFVNNDSDDDDNSSDDDEEQTEAKVVSTEPLTTIKLEAQVPPAQQTATSRLASFSRSPDSEPRTPLLAHHLHHHFEVETVGTSRQSPQKRSGRTNGCTPSCAIL